jgi:hypothetical protein
MKTENIARTALAVLIVLGLSGPAFAGKTIYVDDNAVGSNDGSSWVDAYNYLQDALADANSNSIINEIRVAQGAYKPDLGAGITPGDRAATFRPAEGVALRGGYAGFGAADPDARDFDAYQTILSGDLAGNDGANFADNNENSSHVVTVDAFDVIIDGLTIVGGNANRDDDPYSYYHGYGGGMFSSRSPTLTNVTFTGNFAMWGGGMCPSWEAVLINCTFTGNKAGENGGALWISDADPTLINCTIRGNSATQTGGGVMFNTDNWTKLFNCVISGNSAGTTGGGIHASFCYADRTMVNCVVTGNSAGEKGGGAYFGSDGDLRPTNCIFWGNTDEDGSGESAQFGPGQPEVYYCCIQGWTGNYGGIGSFGDDPQMVDADGPDNVYGTKDDNPRLSLGSPCIDAGDNSAVPPSVQTDPDGNPRIANHVVDVGAYEMQSFLLSTLSLNVPEGGTAALTVALVRDPLQSVDVNVWRHSGDTDLSVATAMPLVFDSSNYAVPQTVLLAAAEDGDYLDGKAEFHVTSPGLLTIVVAATEAENEPVPTVLYVDARATGAADGWNWNDAFTRLEDALGIAEEYSQVEEVRVAGGTYTPAEPFSGDRDATFSIANGLTLLGSYAGLGATDPNARDLDAYTTVLSGDLNGNDGTDFTGYEENSYHVVTASWTDPTTVLDGFEIRGANADFRHGGGIYAFNGDYTVSNCTFIENLAGGGAAIRGRDPAIIDCTFIGNRANSVGGAIRLISSTIGGCTITRCTFIGNSAGGDGGGAIKGSGFTVTDCTFIDNTAFNSSNVVCLGGAIRGFQSTVINSVFISNRAERGGAIFASGGTVIGCTFLTENSGQGFALYGSSVTLLNSIFWNNNPQGGLQIGFDRTGQYSSVSFCNVQGGRQGIYVEDQPPEFQWGPGNISADPCFVDPDGEDNMIGTEDDNLRLLPDSPCVDKGDSTAVPPSVLTDLDGNPRIVNVTVDMGAYEFQSLRILYVDADAPQFGDGKSWATAFRHLQDVLFNATPGTEIRVAEGIYKPHLNTYTLAPPSRYDTFQLMNYVTIKGGYAGLGQPDPDARDISLYETILSGDMNGDDEPNFVNNSDNSYHIVTGSNTNASAVLDGLTIKAGNANGTSMYLDRGGGMYIGGDGSPTVRYCTFSRNTAYADEGGFGAGVFIDRGNPAFRNCDFVENMVDTGIPDHGGGNGAGINNSNGSPELTDCTFVGNLAAGNDGGGFYNSGSSPILTNCTFKKNSARLNGGGICNSAGNPILMGCRFIENSVTSEYACGGGMYDRGSSMVVGGVFIGNTTTYGGGGTCALGGRTTFVNCVFIGNSADEWGGGMGMTGSDIELVNCTFASNSGLYGNAVSCYSYHHDNPSVLKLTNCILWDAGDEIYKNDSSIITVGHSDIQGGWAGVGNINADPCFVDPDGDDNTVGTEDDNLRLSLDSLCIDTGDNTAVPPSVLTDLDGNPRIIGGTVDMGAYEFLGPIYVDDDALNDPGPGDPQVSDPLEDGTEDRPFDTIKEAVDLAIDGYTILVRQGSYFEPFVPGGVSCIDFLGKNITLTSEDPTDWDVVDNTIIQGYVQFSGTEEPNCMFAGFKIRNIEGAIYGNHTHATISHCNISGNGPCGAIVLRDCDGIISNCLITDNTTFLRCGVFPLIFGCNGLIKNCTIANNISGVSVGTATIKNCIIYNNIGSQLGVSGSETLNISYCNLQGGLEGITGGGSINWGPGNIDTDPCFVRVGYWREDDPLELVEGDYHLRTEGWRWNKDSNSWTYDYNTSRCIDAGNPASDLGDELMNVPRDPDNTWGVNLRVNMGAFGGTGQAGMPPYGWTLLPDLNNDGIVNYSDYAYQAQDWQVTAPEQPGDQNRDGVVNKIDLARLANDWLKTTTFYIPEPDVPDVPDVSPPEPAPVILTIQAISPSSISMTSQIVYDDSGVQYYFEAATPGGHDSGWQDEPNYIDVNLVPDTTYCYRVKARDKSVNYNETIWSPQVCAVTALVPDTLPPLPDPMQWDPVVDANGYNGLPREILLSPYGAFDYGATMRAILATDQAPVGVPPAEVEYYFECQDNSAFNSGWRTVALYPNEDDRRTYTVRIGGSGHSYIFRVKARDASDNLNETDWSVWYPAVYVP